ncbi:hypothetical protein CBW53_03005 [Yersinia frederiksenii]|nr:hypothetical protein CBW53_03005 [Yersinia frederiksenii]CNI68717.1 phage antitermination protein [Yersinia frederiksenii]
MRDMQYTLERYGVWAYDNDSIYYSNVAGGFKGLLPQRLSKESCCDDDGLAINSAMRILKKDNPEEYSILCLKYIYNFSNPRIGQKLDYSKDMVRLKLQRAEGFIDGCLCMLNLTLEMDKEYAGIATIPAHSKDKTQN